MPSPTLAPRKDNITAEKKAATAAKRAATIQRKKEANAKVEGEKAAAALVTKLGRRKPLHKKFEDLIVRNVYAPCLWTLIKDNQQHASLSALARAFEDKFECSVTTSQVKAWLDYLGFNLTSRVTLVRKDTGNAVATSPKPPSDLPPQVPADPNQLPPHPEDLTHPNAELPDPNDGVNPLQVQQPLFANM